MVAIAKWDYAMGVEYPGYVYAMRLHPVGCRGRIKIGWGKPHDRELAAKTYGDAEIIFSIPAIPGDEAYLHKRFREYRSEKGSREIFWDEGEVAGWREWLERQPGIGKRSTIIPHGWRDAPDIHGMPRAQLALIDFIPTVGVETEDWGTPPYIVKAVHETFGGPPNLDPATSSQHNQVVRARKILTIETNGLDHEWRGSVFLNPPWGASADIGQRFADKLLSEHDAGRVTESISLWPDRCLSSVYWQPFWARALLCIPNHRIRFGGNGKGEAKGGSPDRGHAIAYIGENGQQFSDAFVSIGHVLEKVRPCSMAPSMYSNFRRVWGGGVA